MARKVLLLALILALPAAAALPIPPTDAAPVAHAVLDTTAYRSQVDKAVAWTWGFQKADGGVYEYEFLQKDSHSVAALRLYANDQRVDRQGAAFQALVGYWETTQRVDGSWGSGYLVPDITSRVVDGLLDAGYDLNATTLQRAILHVELSQNLDGSWTDGAGVRSGSLAAQNVENLLRAGHGRSSERVQDAVAWLLTLQDPATGGFAPASGWSFTTPAATALVLAGLDAYLQASPTGPEAVPQATVQAAADRAVAHLGSTWDRSSGQWQYSTGANAIIVGPAARYHAARGLPMPAWVLGGAKHLLDQQDASGAITNWEGTPILTWTLQGAHSLLEVPRTLRSSDAVPFQATRNDRGDYGPATLTVSLRDAGGAVVASATGPAGAGSLAWSNLPAGKYVVRTEAAGATAHERVLWRA